jgi:hypothetical protein
MCAARKLAQPLLVPDFFEVVLELLLEIVHRELAVFVLVFASVEQHLELLEPFVLLLALAHFHLHLLFLSFFYLDDVLDELLREANRGQEFKLAKQW